MKLKTSKSLGPDGLHPKVLRELHKEVSPPIAEIMRKSLREERLPQEWKSANVSPIFKKGSKSKCTNYRPVSLTSIICKTMESFIRDKILEHMQENHLLSPCQHGFVPGRSCSTQLIKCLDVWTKILDEGSNLDAIYLDFSKAFDSVPHRRLIVKLESYGITGDILAWVTDFLSNRKQRVMVNGEPSEWLQVTSGVPQGSVLGPVLFVVFINDMPEVTHSFMQMFADDAKVFREIASSADTKGLQEDIHKLVEWANTWNMVFNVEKCKVIHLGKNNVNTEYHMGGSKLSTVKEEKDLGVTIDNELKLQQHCDNQVKKANRILGLIRRSFVYINRESFKLLYNALVRTHLEYCNAVTFPQYEYQVKKLEGVQRRATKLVPACKDLPYEERLKFLNLPSLVYRRTRGDVIETYKYLRKINKVQDLPFELVNQDRRTRGHSFKLKKLRSNTSLRQKFFSERIVNLWNNLPANIVEAPSLNSLKSRLDKHWIQYKFTLDKIAPEVNR